MDTTELRRKEAPKKAITWHNQVLARMARQKSGLRGLSMKLKRASCLLSMLLAATAISSATSTVTLDATSNYCGLNCSGVQNLLPGTTITGLVSPISVLLGPGTYIVTNAALSGSNEAWNFDTAGSANWVWAFAAATAGGTVLLDDYVGTSAGNLEGFTSANNVANATGIKIYDGLTLLSATSTASFSDTFTLGSTTTVNFFIPDSYALDNSGGLQLNYALQSTGTPEPAIPLLIGTGLAALALYRRKRQSRVG